MISADDALLHAARERWAAPASVPARFAPGRLDVVVSPHSQLCPPGWCGLVVLGDAALCTTPTLRDAARVRAALDGRPVAGLADTGGPLRAALPVTDVLGPALLAFATADGFRPVPDGPLVHQLNGHGDELSALIGRVPADEAGEAGLEDVTSPLFVARDRAGGGGGGGGDVLAAAGWARWPGHVAHLCVLTAPEARGRGLATAVAAAATTAALADGLLPQWRARPEASRRVARRLGFRALGAQLSFELAAASGA